MPTKFALSVVFGLLLAVAAQAQQIKWVDDLALARQIAAEQNRLILLHFYSDSCPPCERVEKTVFPSAEVADALGRNYVPLKIYVKQAPELVRRYQIDRWPTDLVVTAAGQEVFRTVSPQTPKEYALMLNTTALQAGVGNGRQVGAYTPGSTTASFPADAAGQAQATTSQPAAPAAGPVDSIAAATTMPSQIPPRRNTYGGNFITDSSPMIPTVSGGTPETPQAPTLRDQYGNAINQAANQATTTFNQGAAAYQQGVNAYQQGANAAAQAQTQAQAAVQSVTPEAAAAAAYAAAQAAGNRLANPQAAQQPSQTPGPQWQNNPFVNAAPPAPQPPPSAPVAPQVPPQAAVQTPPPQQPYVNPAPTQPASYAAAAPVVGRPQQPAGPPPLSLDGYCPVTLVEKQKWKKADPRWGAIHRGRTFLFVGEAEQKKFLADPDRFAPVLAGLDPVRYIEGNEMVEGKRAHGLLYHNQIFLFADEASLDRFAKAADRYAATARQAMAQSDTVRR